MRITLDIFSRLLIANHCICSLAGKPGEIPRYSEINHTLESYSTGFQVPLLELPHCEAFRPSSGLLHFTPPPPRTRHSHANSWLELALQMPLSSIIPSTLKMHRLSDLHNSLAPFMSHGLFSKYYTPYIYTATFAPGVSSGFTAHLFRFLSTLATGGFKDLRVYIL